MFKKLLLPILGTFVEYYDYALYGFCADRIALQFFPNDNSTVALLKTFGIFLTGSLAKPIGALLFGNLGDRIGRLFALKISMLGIAIPTLCIGLLPGYGVIGYMAPVLLLLCRIAQGMLTAGESDTVRVFLFESFPQLKPCFLNSLPGVAMFIGIYLASKAAMFDNWRMAFILGALMGWVVFGLRFLMTETTVFKPSIALSKKPFFKNQYTQRMILTAILLCGSSGGGYHFYLVFLGKYLSQTLSILTPAVANQYTSMSILVYTLSIPIASLIADFLGLVRALKLFFGGLIIFVIFNMGMLLHQQWSFALMAATTFFLAAFQTPMYTLLMQAIGVSERCRTLSLGHAIGSSLFSGTAPFISLLFYYYTNSILAPFLYFSALMIMGLMGVFLINPNKVPTVALREKAVPVADF